MHMNVVNMVFMHLSFSEALFVVRRTVSVPSYDWPSSKQPRYL